jgi:hypothetical protein
MVYLNVISVTTTLSNVLAVDANVDVGAGVGAGAGSDLPVRVLLLPLLGGWQELITVNPLASASTAAAINHEYAVDGQLAFFVRQCVGVQMFVQLAI